MGNTGLLLQVERRTHDCARHGNTSLFATVDVKTGKVVGECHRRLRSTEFRRFLDTIEQAVPQQLDMPLMLDNYGTHSTEVLWAWACRQKCNGPKGHMFTNRQGWRSATPSTVGRHGSRPARDDHRPGRGHQG